MRLKNIFSIGTQSLRVFKLVKLEYYQSVDKERKIKSNFKNVTKLEENKHIQLCSIEH